jgi:Rhs element Vgr protein
MSNTRVLPISESAGVVTFSLLIDGNNAPDTLEFMSVVTNKEANKIPYARIILRDGDVALEDFEVSNQNLFVPGNNIEIQMGYDSDNATVFKGIIIKHSIKIRETQGSFLEVECRDETVKTTIGRKNKYFEDTKDSDAIKSVLGNYGLSADITATSLVHKELIQYYCTDWDFVLSRAEANSMLVLVNDGKVKVAKPEIESPKFSVNYGSTLYEYEAEMDARYQYSSVKSSSWDYKNQAILEKNGNTPPQNSIGNLTESSLSDVIGLSDFELRHSGKLIDEELQAWADAQRVKSSLAKVVGRAKIQGIADIAPGDTVEFQGVGDRFNGNGFITGVRHEMVEGSWYTHIQFGKTPEWFYKENHTMDKPASGLLPGINGLQIGIVKKLEGDPDGEDRIQVMIPIIDTAEKGIWTRIASLDAGKERGFVFRPEIGDEVIVGFINDDPRDAIVLGMLHSSKLNAPVPPADDNHEKGLVSRSKMRQWLDDDKIIMTFDTPAGNKIEINEDTTSITVEDQNGNKIVLNDSGIEINSASDIKMEATGKIEIKAGQDCKIEGLNIEAKANAEFKADGAAGAKLTTSAIAEVKGSLVKIN